MLPFLLLTQTHFFNSMISAFGHNQARSLARWKDIFFKI